MTSPPSSLRHVLQIYSPTVADEDELSALAPLPPTMHVPDALELLETKLDECFSPVAQHVSAGIQLHSCSSIDEVSASPRPVRGLTWHVRRALA